MASVVLTGDTSGTLTVSAPAVAGSNTQTLVATTGTLAPIVSGTAVTASSTSVDFTSIPSWVKRITVMLSGVSTNGTSIVQIQIGSGSVSTSGYTSGSQVSAQTSASTGFILTNSGSTSAANVLTGSMTLSLLNSNTWVANGVMYLNSSNNAFNSGVSPALGGALDRVRLTTVNGTDAFDAGTINILYE